MSLYNNNWLVFIAQKESVYCAVKTGSRNIIQATFRRQKLNEKINKRQCYQLKGSTCTL